MNRYHQTLRCLLATLIVGSSGFLSCPSAHAVGELNQVPASIQKKVQSLTADLTAKGFEVAQGSWNLFKISDCDYAIASIGNCLGNNPAAPYIIPSVPLWPDEFADPHMKGILGPTTGGDSWTYRLGDREAIVVLGQLPPQGRYFGMQTYVFSREGSINTSDPIYQSLTDAFMKGILFMNSPNPARPLVLSSIGDSINNVTIERQSGSAFNQERSFIITPDSGMNREMNGALLRAGVTDGNQIFTEPVSPGLTRVGLGSSADDFMTLIRYALPDNESAGDQWRQQLPMVVLRVREKSPTRAADPYPLAVRDPRTARSELALKGDASQLVNAVKQKWNQPAASDSASVSLLQSVDLVGDECLKRPMNCLAENGDTDYQISQTASLDSGEVLAMVGTLGTATGNATYSSLSVNWIPPLKGVLNVSDKELTGSASSFSSTVPNADKFYVQYFARDCTNIQNCSTITEEMIPRGGSIKVIQRNYIVPGSNRGADPAQVLNPTMIVLDGNKRPAAP